MDLAHIKCEKEIFTWYWQTIQDQESESEEEEVGG